MENENHHRFLPALELGGEHDDLHGDGGDDEEIVARESGALCGQKRCVPRISASISAAEQARPGLLQAEADELVERVGGGTPARPGADAGLGLDEAGKWCPDAGGAVVRTLPVQLLHKLPQTLIRSLWNGKITHALMGRRTGFAPHRLI